MCFLNFFTIGLLQDAYILPSDVSRKLKIVLQALLEVSTRLVLYLSLGPKEAVSGDQQISAKDDYRATCK